MSFFGDSIIKGFDWDTFGYLLDFGGEGATNSVLQFFVDYSFTIAFVLGMVALCFSIIKIMSSQNPDIPMLVLKFFLTMSLIFTMNRFAKVRLIMLMT